MNDLNKLLENIENAVVLFHIDTDGVCSAKIVSEALNRMSKEVLGFYPTTPKLLHSNNFQESIEKNEPDLIIIVDVALNKNSAVYQNNKDKKFLILDHHSVNNIPQGGNVHYFNPKLERSEEYVPASKVCYDKLKKVVDISDLDWVAAVGVIGDSGAKMHEKFIKKVIKKYDLSIGKDEKFYFDSFLGVLSEMINSGKIIKGNDGALTALKLLQEAADPVEFYENSYQLREWNNKIQNYLEQCISDFKKSKDEVEGLDLYFYTFKPEYTLGSVLSTIVSFEEPHKTVIIFSKKNGVTTINFRRQDKKYHMGVLASKSTEPFKHAGGGGHKPAAGGHIRTEDLNKVKNKIILELKKLMK